jgi:hypothetical protein
VRKNINRTPRRTHSSHSGGYYERGTGPASPNRPSMGKNCPTPSLPSGGSTASTSPGKTGAKRCTSASVTKTAKAAMMAKAPGGRSSPR